MTKKSNKKNIKKLQDLNLLDRFLFAEAMEDPIILRYTLEILLGRDISLKDLPQTEKEQRRSPLSRFIKLDVWATDTDDVIYDTEVQQRNTCNLPKRTRLYQALIDVKLLAPGETDFNKMNTVYVIIIAPFDLFGYGLYQYTFENKCKEVPELSLGDGATRIIFNTHGTNDAKTRPELIELLHYIENTTEEVSEQCQSNKIKEMQKRIHAIKSSEEVGVKYMQAWEELAEAKNEGRTEGRAEGGIIKLIQQVCKKLVKGKSPEEIADALEEDLPVIESICKAAKQCDDLQDYDRIYELWSGEDVLEGEDDEDSVLNHPLKRHMVLRKIGI